MDQEYFSQKSIGERLIAAHSRFCQKPLRHHLFVNSVPKAGTMLLRNIVLMFVPLQQIEWPFVTNANLPVPDGAHVMRTGHLTYSPKAAAFTAPGRHLLIVRHPHTQVLAFARFMWSEQMMETPFGAEINDRRLGFDDVVRKIIKGWQANGNIVHDVRTTFDLNALQWANRTHVVRYEELLDAVRNMNEIYFSRLLGAAGIELPADWRDRVSAGADRSISGTDPTAYSPSSRKRLTWREKRLFNKIAPGLCADLGYPNEPIN